MTAILKSWKTRFKSLVTEDQLHQHEDKLFLILTLLIGALVGLVIAGFIVVTENLGARMYPAGGSAWRRLLIPTLGSLFTGILLYRYFPGARGSGIPQTKVALFLQDGVILFRTVLGRFGLSSVSLASGIALGREGPSVQVGAGIASTLGRWLNLGPDKIRMLIPVGASAALAAAFNTPIAAVLFTLEEVMGDMHAPVLGSVVLSSATSWIVLHLVLGDEPLFHVPSYQLVHPAEFLAYAVLGVLGGLVSVVFVKLLLRIRMWFLGLPKHTVWLQPVAGGLLVGVLGWFFPDVLGVGYAHVSQALNSQLAISAMALLVVLKIVATATCYSSGNAGGIFGPSLFIGAMMGGALGSGVHSLFPSYTGSAGAYALVGMGTSFAGIIRTPMTSVIMIFEITRDYSIIVPLMISNLISYLISHRFQPEPIYESLQHQEGIHLPPSARVRENVLLVNDALAPANHVVEAATRVEDAVAHWNQDVNALPVTDRGRLLGVVTQAQLHEVIDSGRGSEPIDEILPSHQHYTGPQDLAFPHIFPDDSLDKALRQMADGRVNLLPVINRGDIRQLVGVVSRRAILDTYDLGSNRRRAAQPEVVAAAAQRGLLIGLTSAVLALLIVIGFLNYHYRVSRQSRAQEYYAAGNELLRQSRPADAVEQFRNALSTSPENADYRLALGSALVEAGNPLEAEIYLLPLLRAHPDDGRINLSMGRGAAKQGKRKETEEYYHRAIFGAWPRNVAEERLSARFEFVDFLMNAGAKTQAISELLAVPEQAPDNVATLQRVGQLLYKLGAARQAMDVFQMVLRQDDRDSPAYEGVGLAQISLGDYQAALGPLRDAVKWDPTNESAKRRLESATEVVALNPSARGLSGRERYRRSQMILQRAVHDMETCVTVDPASTELKSAQSLLVTARQALLRRQASASTSDSIDQNIARAEELWKIHQQSCSSGETRDDTLDQVFALLAR